MYLRFLDRAATGVHTLVEARAWAIIDVDMVHSARVGTDAARVIALEPGYNTAALEGGTCGPHGPANLPS